MFLIVLWYIRISTNFDLCHLGKLRTTAKLSSAWDPVTSNFFFWLRETQPPRVPLSAGFKSSLTTVQNCACEKPCGSFESFRSCWDHFTMKQPLKSSKWQPWKRSFLFPSMFQMPETVQTGTERHLRAQRIGGCWSTGWWLDYSRWWAYLWHFHQPARFAWYWPIADMVSQPLDI